MHRHLRLVADNSGGRIGPARPKQRRIKLDVVLGAQITEPLMNRQTVRESTELPPIAYTGRKHPKGFRHSGCATKGLNRIVDSHDEEDNSSSLDKSRGLDVGRIIEPGNGIIPAMPIPAHQLPEKHPRHIESIAARLLELRTATNLSQREFCARAGIGTTTYNNWERGLGRPELDKAMQLCDAYQITLDWLYRGNPAGLPYHVAEILRAERHATG